MSNLIILLPGTHYVPRAGEHVIDCYDVVYIDSPVFYADDWADLVNETAYALRLLMQSADTDHISIIGQSWTLTGLAAQSADALVIANQKISRS